MLALSADGCRASCHETDAERAEEDLADLGPEVHRLLAFVDLIRQVDLDSGARKEALQRLSIAIQPEQLRADVKHVFVARAIKRGIIDTAVCIIETSDATLAGAACDFLGDFAFNSDLGGKAVVRAFDRIIHCLTRIFRPPECRPLVGSAISLCANIVATCPSSHAHLIPLVKPVFLKIIRDPHAPDALLASTILLLANLTMTVREELRDCRVGEVLLDLVLQKAVRSARKSVAESVIIFLLGHQQCKEVDQLVSAGALDQYCIPIMMSALVGAEFRGMYPHLVYSARLFQILAQSQEYATMLVTHERVVPLLLQATRKRDERAHLESDNEGRRLALEALWSFARFGLWPIASSIDLACSQFICDELPALLEDDHVGVRAGAAGLWAQLNLPHLKFLLRVGQRLGSDNKLPTMIWRQRVLVFLFPSLDGGKL